MSSRLKRKPRTSFGTTAPPFIDYLKDILRRYPDGGQILKELIQNADDAQATEVVFIHDERNYGTESLWTDELGEYQGPALYTYNNAAFTDDDWKGIQMAGRSIKKDDPNKVGRFGIGFNSVYHITDVPGIFSSGHLGMMDPQEKIFGDRNSGFWWSLQDQEDREALMAMRDQFQPFRDIVELVSGQEWSKVIMEDEHFDGTIFRFPLRNKASDISDNLYDSDKVVDLFDSFILDADLSLLFLKNVASVSLIHIDVSGNVNTRLQVKSSVNTDIILDSKDLPVIEGSTRFKTITFTSDKSKETKWLVTTCTMKEGNVKNLDSLAKKLSFFPRVDLAFPCEGKRQNSESRLSCFLPLPNNESNKTGFPVYVNACFGLTDNRRHIKWQEEDQKHDEHAVWNELLMKEVLPQAYLMIIQDAIKLAQESVLPVSSVYELWPDIARIKHKDKWHAVALDVLDHLFRGNVPVLSLAKNERRFITPSEAVLPCNGPTGPDTLAAIERTLVTYGENLVTLPGAVARAINETYPHLNSLKKVTPTFLRNVLRRLGVHSIPKDDKLRLLEYILSDEQYRELQGLQLLPREDGSFRCFTDREEDSALIDSNEFPRLLLPYCKHLFIPDDLSPGCRAHLKEMARRNLFKVISLDAEWVVEYMRRSLPEDWKQMKMGLVTWDTSSSQQPPVDWLKEFWKFLNTHFRELSNFTEMPLIPVSPLSVSQPVTLAGLQHNTTLIFQKSKRLNLPEQIGQLVNRFGGTVVRGNEWLKHEDLDSYVLCPSPPNVLKILMNLNSQDIIRELKSASSRALEELKDYLSRLDSLSASERDLLSKLPLFQTMKGSRVTAQSKQAVLLTSDLTIPTEFPMPDTVVQCASDADHRLLQLLKVNLLNTAEAANILIDCIVNRGCEKEDTEKIMAWILQHGSNLFSQNETLKSRCKDLSFIEVNGELKKTSSLFDQRVQTFEVIFESDFFPPPIYTHTAQMIESLIALGLRHKEDDVSPEHVLHAITLIDKLQVHSPTEAIKRAQVLLKMLDKNDLLSKFSSKQLNSLKMLKWIPCTKPCNAKKHSNDTLQKGLFCPNEVRHSDQKNIVGHVMPLVGDYSERVNSKLDLKRQPPPEKVLENLSVLKSKAQKMADPDTDGAFKTQLYCIYKHMQDNVSEFAPLINGDKRWVWSHNEFVSPEDLVLDFPQNLDLSSYIGKLSNEFRPYTRLFQEFGLRTMLSDEDIIGILRSIQQTIKGRNKPFATSSEIKVSIEILNWLWREKKTVQVDIPVPVLVEGDKYTLKPLSTAVFCDVSKGGLKDINYSHEDIHVIHEEIPKATAEWLNIQFLSTYILDPELVGIEQCGQSEPITTRIKNILKEYDEESDIFKELIQNAEDAGAGACKFLVDFRVHKDSPESLIDPGMTLCQGPCLWAFNDEQFTAADWANIVRVGSASKENKVEKIGKFGLGFNTVYHVTDIPSVLSGNGLLILDPNVTHLKKHIKHKTNPGIKLNLSQHRLFHCFPGQFRAYERIFDCNFSKQSHAEAYPGTLIKLPFRTEEEALISEISTKVYHKDKIINLQKQFAENSPIHLLFLKKINTLSLQSMSKDVSTPPKDGEIETVLTVSKTTLSTMEISDQTNIARQFQSEKSLTKLSGICKEVIDCRTVNIVQITSQRSGVTEVQAWLLYNCYGTHQSLEMALKGNKHAAFSLPIGGVAVPLQNDTDTGKLATDFVGQAFSFLPLSIHTGLPINVNGTFAVTSNRKGLWESGVKHEWNKALLQDPVVTAYLTALSALKTMSESGQLKTYSYHTFWPDREKVSGTFKPLVDAFYSAIAQNPSGPQLFSDGESWCSMNNAIFLHESIEEDKDMCALVMEVCKKHAKSPNHIVPLPVWLRNSFKQAGLEKVLQNRTWTWEKFYQEAVFNNLGSMDSESRDTLVLHAIDLNIKEIDNLLVCYRCIPTKGGQLQYIKKLVNPSGKVACLFEQEEGRLLGGTKNGFCSPKRIQRLLELGMANDHLPLEDITEKASTISKTWTTDSKKAYGNLKCLLDLLKNHMDNTESHHWETLRMTDFLPAISPGKTKKKRQVTFRCPTDIFHDKHSLLVSMTKPVLDCTNLNLHDMDMVLQMLGVHDCLDPDTVLEQLQEASEHSQSIDNTTLHKIAYECYTFLDKCVRESEGSSLISERANSFPFILIGSTFVDVKHVAENGDFEVKPYLHVIPPIFDSFKRLWESIGVEKHFTISQFLTVLEDLHSQHGNNPLPKEDLLICLTILNRGIYAAKEKTSDCLIPNEHDVLQPASKMFYNDSPWIGVDTDITLCHSNIPRVMARHFGIKTTRHHTLEKYADESSSPFSFEFQQQEQLTVRIKNIISAYPAKKDIIKELIQNADDAEATEIHFIWDKRKHAQEKTFGKRWNSLQGPALCVFNNKVFSEADLAGIQQLGEGGKHNSPGKTGKYGVGFNSVYHLTDCPSILTGDKKLCISDPNQKYIEGHSGKSLAGIGYNLDDMFKNMYMDVYKSFLPDKYALEEGTMFRLPIRMGPMANNSKISQQGVTDHDMKALCSVLSEDPEGLILFLKNICKIQVHQINEDSENLETIFKVEKTVPQTSREERDAFQKLQHDALLSGHTTTPQKNVYKSVISTSDKRQSTWVIAEQFGAYSSGEREIPQSDKLPQAAVAARVSLKVSPYLQPSSFVGEAFCSLPLPGKTGLPVHVNANFEVDSARRNLWKEDGKSLKSDWNEFLKQNVIAPLYTDLLHCIAQNIPKKKVLYSQIKSYLSSSYLCFWPTVSKDVGQDWHEMIHEVYRSIKERGLNVIPVMKSCKVAKTKFEEYSFDLCNVRETEATRAPYLTQPGSDDMNPILQDLRMTLVPFSEEMQKVWKSFKLAGVEVKKIDPSTVRAFLKAKQLNDPTQTDKDLPLPITATLIRNEKRCAKLLSFCLKDANLTPDNVTGLPLLLTRDKVLRVFDSKSPKQISRYEGLFIDHEDKFADHETNKGQDEVLQRMKFVQSLTIACAAKYLKPLIQRHLRSCEVDQHSGLHVPNEDMLKWLKLLWQFLKSEIKTAAESGQTLSDVRKLFNECCILPVVCPRDNNKPLLQTMKDMESVVQFFSDEDITTILFKIGFMKLDNTFFSKVYVDPHDRLLLHSELMNVNDKNSVLDQLYKINHSEFSHLTPAEKEELQEFLQSGVSRSKDKQGYQRKFRSLPLFETIHGKHIRIDGPKAVFILNTTCSMRFPDFFTLADRENIFLKYNQQNSSLSSILNIQILSDLEYIMKFILPVVHTLTEKQMLECVKLLLSPEQHFSYIQNKDKMIPSLKTVKFIRNSQGSLETASYYFDQSVELYKKFIQKQKFVPEGFWTELCEGKFSRIEPETITKFLRELGMKHVVSKDDIIHFAHQLESEAQRNGQVEELKKKSSLLFREALTNEKLREENLLNVIADIKFIFPVKIKKELCDYHQPFAGERCTVKIRGSLIDGDSKHQELIWTSMSIIHIPVYKSQKIRQMLKSAGAHEEAPTNCVTSNMSNICQSPCKNDQVIKTRAEVFRSSYAYLQANGFNGQDLAGLPVVLVEKDKKLARSDDVSFSLPYHLEFRPYLYRVSPENVLFADFFKKIGVKNEPTAAQYCNVLAAIHADSCETAQLNPNQLKTVKRAVEQFFKLIKSQKNQSLVENVKTLYLPAVDGKLYPSCTLYYNDTVFETKRLEDALGDKFLLLERLSECHLGNDIFESNRLMKMLCQRFQPKMLSQVTEERVVESHMEFCELDTDCEFNGWFDTHLTSSVFTYGLICLIREQSHGETTQEEAADMCVKTFGNIKIVCCKNLETELWVDKQPLPNTATETDVFVQRGQEDCTFYLKHNDELLPKVINEINMTLTREMNALLGSRIASAHLPVLGHLLMCDTLEEVRKTLAKNGIRDSAKNENLVFAPPAPGTDIPEELHDFLDMNVLNNFEEGEYVGYSIDNTDKYIYAVIVEELPGYSGSYSRRYRIDIGEEELVEVSCIDLFQFTRGRKQAPEERTSAKSSCMELELLVGDAPHSSRPSTASSSSARSSPKTVDEAKLEIDKCLEEIWTLPKEERDKAIRRLYLRWHPDKNPDCELLTTEAFKYLKNRIKELEEGKSKGKTSASSSSRGYSNFTSSNFSDFFYQWDQEAGRHRSNRERSSRGRNSYNFWTHNDNSPKPNKEEAQRWFRQARCDLNAAHKDVGGASTEWCLYKIHQAVEKSLTAAQYKRHGRPNTNSSITTMAAEVSLYSPQLRNLPEIVARLKTLGVDAKKTQYPNCHRFPHIPNEQFNSENEMLALDKATELLSKVEAYVK